MSTTIDQKVVEMRFDHKQFQAGVADTVASLDKLDKKLQLKDASKGLESVTRAAKRVDLSSVGDSADKIGLRFNAMYTMADQALRDITHSAIAAGKKIVSALTIDPIKTGFQEYETQINAVQTILANTQSKGTTIDHVNAALEELNKYADQTIYNFTEMTRNIGTFTAAGVGLETSVQSIKGIANLAAVSGSNAQQASTAMYQLSQALSSGTVKLMDWNSVVNAGMGGQVFQDALKETARVHGVAIDNMIKNEGSFRETLKDGWLTSEILTETLDKFTQTTEGLTEAEIKANQERWKSLGYTDEQIDGIFKLGKTATDAATKVKTFTQLWDVLKESAQSGWSQTWKLIFGDFEEAKSLFTPIANVLTNFINGISDARNTLLKSALSSPFKELAEKIKNVTKPIDDMNKKLQDFDDIVNKVIRGDLGNMQTRFDKLTEMGYDWAHVQNLVNEKLGDSTRYATDYKETQEKITDQTIELTDAKLKEIGLTEDEIKLYRKLEKQAKETGVSVTELIDSMGEMDGRTMLIESFKNVGSGLLGVLKAIGSAWSEIFAIEPIQLYNFIKGFNELTSSLRLTDKETGELNETGQKIQRTFKGVFAALDIVLTIVSGPIKLAFKIFSSILSAAGMTILDFTAFVGDGIVKLRDFIDSILNFGEIFDWIVPYIKKASDAIRKWIDAVKPSEKVAAVIDKVADAIHKWADEVKPLEKIADTFHKVKDAISSFSKTVWNSDISQGIYSGLVNGIQSGAKAVWDAMVNIGKHILEAIKNVLGIHSPSTEFFEIGKNIIAGLLNGLQAGITAIGTAAQELCSKLFGAFENVDLSKISTVFTQIARLFPQLKIFTYSSALINIFKEMGGNISEGLANGISGGAPTVFGAIVSLANGLIDSIKNALGIHSPSKVFFTIGKFLIAGLILGIVGSKTGLFDALQDVAGTVVTFFKEHFGKLVEWFKNLNLPEIKWEYFLGIGVIVGLVATIVKVLKIFEMFGEGVQGFGKMCSSAGGLMSALTKKLEGVTAQKGKMESIGTTMLKFSIAIAILSASVYALAQLDYGKLWSAIGAVTVLGGVIIGLSLVLKAVSSSDPVAFGKFALCVLSIGASVLILAKAIKMMESMSPDSLKKSIQVVGLLVGFMTAFSILSKIGTGSLKGVLPALIGMAVALRVLVGTIKIIDGMSPESLKKGVQVIGVLMTFMSGFALLSSIGGGSYKKLGSTLRNLAISLLILVGVIKIVDGMSVNALIKGGIVIASLMTFMAIFVKIISFSTGFEKVGRTLFAMSAALAILVGVIFLIDKLSVGSLIKGGIVIGALMTFMAIFVKVVSYSGQFEKVGRTLFAVSAAIAILVGVMFVISLLSPEGIVKGMAVVLGLGMLLRALLVATKGVENCKGNLIAMSVAIGILAIAVAGLSFIDPKKLGNAMVALGTVMGMFALIVKMGSNVQSSMGPLIVMTVAIGVLAGALYLVAQLPVDSVLASTASLSTALLAIAITMAIVSKIPVQGAAYGVAGLAVVIGGLAAILAILGGLNQIPGFSWIIGEGSKVLGQIGYAIGNFVGSIIGGFSAGVTSGLPVIGQNLSDFMTNIQGFVTGISAIDPTILTGVKTLCESILMLTAANFLDSITPFIPGGSSLADFGGQLSIFADSFKIFADKVNAIDESAIAKTTLVAAAMKALTEMASSIPNSGGVVGWFMGENDIDAFGTKLTSFGTSFAAYSNSIANVNDNVATKTTLVYESMKMLNEIANNIPNSGGMVALFTGENDLDAFGTKIKSFAASFVDYSQSVAGVNDNVVSKTTLIYESMKKLSEMATAIPNSGGMVAWFTGDNDLDTFGMKLRSFGQSFATYSIYASIIMDNVVEKTGLIYNSMVKLNDIATAIPNSGGMVSLFTGDNDLDDFGAKLVSFAESFVNYSNTVKDINTDKLNVVTDIVKDLSSLSKKVTDTDADNLESFTDGLINVAKDVSKFSSTIGDAGIKGVKTMVTDLKSLCDFINSISSIDTSGVSRFTAALNELGTISVDGMVKSFKNASVRVGQSVSEMMTAIIEAVNGKKTSIAASFTLLIQPALDAIKSSRMSFYVAGSELMTGFVAGVNSHSGSIAYAMTGFTSVVNTNNVKVSQSFVSMVDKMISNIRSKYTSFFNSGKYLVDGFVKGIKVNTFKASAQARAMARAAEQAANDELKVNSPSKKFIKLGKSTGEGFVKGIDKSTPDAENAGRYMAESTLKATQDELDINSPSIVFSEEVGRYIVQGVADGIKKDMSAEEQAEKKAQNIVDAFQNKISELDVADEEFNLKLELGWIHDDGSTIKRQEKRLALARSEYLELEKYLGANSLKTKEAYNKYLQEELDLQEQVNKSVVSYEKSSKWIEERSVDNKAALEEELKAWTKIKNESKEGSDYYKIATKEMVRIKGLLSETLDPEDEVAAWLRVVARCTEGTEEWTNATENLHKAIQKVEDASYNNSLKWIENHENDVDFSLIDRLSAWQRVQNRWKGVDDEKYKEARDNVQDILKELEDAHVEYFDDVTTLQKQHNEERKQLDDDYEAQCEERKKQLEEDIADLNQSYDDALKSKTDSIYGSYGLFDKAKPNKYVSGTALIEHLQSQVDQLDIWRKDLNELTSKGIEEGLIDELREMGPSAAAQIEALNKLSDVELNQYVELWREKHTLAKEQATYELEDMRVETEKQIELLRQEADEELEEYKNMWTTNIQELNNRTQTELNDLKNKWMKKIGLIKTTTENEFATMVTNIVKIVGDGQTWTEAGATIIEGILKGIGDNAAQIDANIQEICESALESAKESLGLKTIVKTASRSDSAALNTIVKSASSGLSSGLKTISKTASRGSSGVGEAMLNTAKKTLGINSPSKEFEKIGRYSVEGFIVGLKNFTRDVVASSEDLGNAALESLRNTIAKIAYVVENEIDAEPTIRPVLDLSNVAAGINGLDSMFSRSQALSINSSMNRQLSEENQNGDNSTAGGNTYTFTQNNYSPKALSRIEIYRQTKNQFSAMKGLVKS